MTRSSGPADYSARLLGQKFNEAWAKPFVVENVLGVAGCVAAERVAKAGPDGYIKAEIAKRGRLVRESGAKMD